MRASGTGEARSGEWRWSLGAFLWGLAEASAFFIVPDVLISFAGLRSGRKMVASVLWAVVGAVLGGAAMWWFATREPAQALAFVSHVPGISRAMVLAVGERTRDAGLVAVILGPLRGIPYKIYAVQWGANGEPLGPFMLASVAARVPRFVLVGLAARGVALLDGKRQGGSSARRLDVVAALFWVAFYAWYLTALAPGAVP